ncbi:hypothetical protein B0H34DRAFT_678359 [Crassisporium funariophilum]|nr:hypothetical protein B0H34DRAFT_678359 [Crassisporium funariophilum]
MPQPKTTRKEAAAQARAGEVRKAAAKHDSDNENNMETSTEESETKQGSDIECTGQSGGIAHVPSDSDDNASDWEYRDTDSEASESDGEEMEDLKGADLIKSLRKWYQLEMELEELAKPTPYKVLMLKRTRKDWTKAEAKRGLGYNGLSARWKRKIAQHLQEKEEKDKETRARYYY